MNHMKTLTSKMAFILLALLMSTAAMAESITERTLETKFFGKRTR